MKEHLTSKEVTDWRSGVSDAEEILRLDDHLAECAECRSLVFGSPDVSGNDRTATAIDALHRELASDHLTEAQLDDFAAHKPLSADLMQHLDQCGVCHADADDLRRFADENRAPAVPVVRSGASAPVAIRPGRVWLRPMAAGLAITALGATAWLAIHRHQSSNEAARIPVPEAIPQIAANLPSAYQSEVKTAIDSGHLRIPSSISEMTAGPIQLRSVDAAKTPAFHVISPLATAVVEDAPVLRWTPVEGATYDVAIYDDQFRAVASASALTAPAWRPEVPLARGAVYRWEVRAVKGKHVDRAPSPTQPEARFAVLDETAARRLSEARTTLHNSPLELGVLYANAGALDDARRELASAAESGDPGQRSAAVQFLKQLK